MNYHYMEYMITERRKEEVEEYNRMHLLADAGYVNAGLMKSIGSGFSKVRYYWRALLVLVSKVILKIIILRTLASEVKGRRL